MPSNATVVPPSGTLVVLEDQLKVLWPALNVPNQLPAVSTNPNGPAYETVPAPLSTSDWGPGYVPLTGLADNVDKANVNVWGPVVTVHRSAAGMVAGSNTRGEYIDTGVAIGTIAKSPLVDPTNVNGPKAIWVALLRSGVVTAAASCGV